LQDSNHRGSEEYRYSEGHLWVKRQGDEVVIGVTDFAIGELGDIVFVELPECGRHLDRGEPLCSLESVKTVTELYSPVSGTVTRINGELAEAPDRLNESPFQAGWLAVLRPDHPEQWDELLTAERYRTMYGLEADERQAEQDKVEQVKAERDQAVQDAGKFFR
jgi:glycine cleavage system H protein